MATTSYFEEEIPQVGRDGGIDRDAAPCQLEIMVSSFSRDHELYLKHTDSQGNVSFSLVTKEQAKRLYDGLDSAMSYLGYIE